MQFTLLKKQPVYSTRYVALALELDVFSTPPPSVPAEDDAADALADDADEVEAAPLPVEAADEALPDDADERFCDVISLTVFVGSFSTNVNAIGSPTA